MSYQEKVLSHLRQSLFSVLTEEEISPEEVFEAIREETASLVEYHKNHLSRSEKFYEYLTSSTFSMKSKEKKKWRLSIEVDPSGEYFVTFPDDLLETANLKEGDELEWLDQGDGSYLLKKVEQTDLYQGSSLHLEELEEGYCQEDFKPVDYTDL